ncbi:MurG-like transferase [Polystyrenella longa]|uniref:MurG-like transferase n=1 Tax=Polystyrenella longa TaxID=2528007 RepID=A0A518CH73_9PLAN|nr:glycosyltransferase [Polystyrenella longa]QDU78573.1 MurG-like transferase [Polystyrenella longa]
MKLLLLSIGTRGDVEPFIYLGELLTSAGHDVVCVFPEQFREITEQTGLRFVSLGPELVDLMHSKEAKAAVGGGGSLLRKVISYLRLAWVTRHLQKEAAFRQRDVIEAEQPDRVVHNFVALYPVLWGLAHDQQTVMISPIPYILHPTHDHAHIGMGEDRGRWINRATYRFALFLGTMGLWMMAGWLGMRAHSMWARGSWKRIHRQLFRNQTVFMVSPSLFARPSYWPPEAHVLGYHARNKKQHWDPSPELLAFMERHADSRILLMTFGSMTNPDPEGKTRMIVETLQEQNQPAILCTSAGGLVEPAEYDHELIHIAEQIPYDWLLDHVHAVVHHGGSGTTHLALKHGCAAMIIPHVIDQYMWNQLVHDSGAGPLGMSIRTFTQQKFATKLTDLMSNDSYKRKAEELAKQMQAEDFRDELLHAIVDGVD